ncbi:hypothetical protein AOY52_08470 [Escherichia coli]|nr:hypothetical protein AOY52_08470 [Escherichia coli]
MSIKNDGHYFCRAGGNRPDGLNEPVTFGGKTSIFSHPVYLFLREFSLQDFRGGSVCLWLTGFR